MLPLAVAAAFLVWMLVSVVSRAHILSARARSRNGVEAVPSPLSEALKHTLATAGGIYLVLVAAIAFLDLNVPGQVVAAGIRFNPVALLSLVLASVQPYWHLVRS